MTHALSLNTMKGDCAKWTELKAFVKYRVEKQLNNIISIATV